MENEFHFLQSTLLPFFSRIIQTHTIQGKLLQLNLWFSFNAMSVKEKQHTKQETFWVIFVSNIAYKLCMNEFIIKQRREIL